MFLDVPEVTTRGAVSMVTGVNYAGSGGQNMWDLDKDWVIVLTLYAILLCTRGNCVDFVCNIMYTRK